jgi:hypothetical protein
LRSLGNLRIAQKLWFNGIRWGQAHGFKALDFAACRAEVRTNDPKFNTYKNNA